MSCARPAWQSARVPHARRLLRPPSWPQCIEGHSLEADGTCSPADLSDGAAALFDGRICEQQPLGWLGDACPCGWHYKPDGLGGWNCLPVRAQLLLSSCWGRWLRGRRAGRWRGQPAHGCAPPKTASHAHMLLAPPFRLLQCTREGCSLREGRDCVACLPGVSQDCSDDGQWCRPPCAEGYSFRGTTSSQACIRCSQYLAKWVVQRVPCMPAPWARWAALPRGPLPPATATPPTPVPACPPAARLLQLRRVLCMRSEEGAVVQPRRRCLQALRTRVCSASDCGTAAGSAAACLPAPPSPLATCSPSAPLPLAHTLDRSFYKCGDYSGICWPEGTSCEEKRQRGRYFVTS